MHIVELAFRMRHRNRSAALTIQRAWIACRKPLRQAIVCGPSNYNLTRMVHQLGGFYQTHASAFTTHFIAEADAPPPHAQQARLRCPKWLYRLHAAHASPEQMGLGRSPACNAHDGPVNLPLLHECDLEVDHEVFEPTNDGKYRKRHSKIVTCHFGHGYKRSKTDATPMDVVVGTCTYRACPSGTLVGPLVNGILAMVLRRCRRTRRLFCVRRGEAKHRHAVALQRFVRRRNPAVRKMVFDRVYKNPPPPPVYRSLAVSAPMAPTAEQHMRQHVDDPSAPYYRRYSRGLNLDVTCPACQRMHIVPLGYGTFDGSIITRRQDCPPCRATASGSTGLVACSC